MQFYCAARRFGKYASKYYLKSHFYNLYFISRWSGLFAMIYWLFDCLTGSVQCRPATKVRSYAYYILSYVKNTDVCFKKIKYAYDTLLCCFRKVQHSLVMVLYFGRRSVQWRHWLRHADLDKLNNRLLLYSILQSYNHNEQSIIMIDFVWTHVIKV